jgi:hypothetical protein
MKKLKLPVIREDGLPPRVLSMDEYLKFVQFNLEHVFDRKSYRKRKKEMAVNTPFVIKSDK